MKILHVITGIDRGGAEGHLLELVKPETPFKESSVGELFAMIS